MLYEDIFITPGWNSEKKSGQGNSLNIKVMPVELCLIATLQEESTLSTMSYTKNSVCNPFFGIMNPQTYSFVKWVP